MHRDSPGGATLCNCLGITLICTAGRQLAQRHTELAVVTADTTDAATLRSSLNILNCALRIRVFEIQNALRSVAISSVDHGWQNFRCDGGRVDAANTLDAKVRDGADRVVLIGHVDSVVKSRGAASIPNDQVEGHRSFDGPVHERDDSLRADLDVVIHRRYLESLTAA